MKLLVSYLVPLLHFGTIQIHAFPNFSGSTATARNHAALGHFSFNARSHNLIVRDGSSNSCEDPCRRRCRGRRIKNPKNCKKCNVCPVGTKPDAAHVICVPNESDDDREKKRKGNCPGDTVLDLKEGPQNPDADAKDLKCAIDDEKDCKPPKLPETRPDGKENDASFKPQCLDADENDKTKCDEKQQFAEVTVGPDGKAKKTCRPTRQYQNKKKSRWSKMKDKFKQRWEEKKEERAKKNEERKARKDKIEEARKQKEKEINDDKKKKLKCYKCGMATVMEAGQQIAGLIQKRDLAKKEEGNAEIESYMDMAACYFNADFVEDDQFLEYWPSDINVDNIGTDVDEMAYMEAFMDRMEKADFDFWNSHDFCQRSVNGTLDARCQRKKRGEITEEKEYNEKRERIVRILNRDILKSNIKKRDEVLNDEDFCDMTNVVKREVPRSEAVDKRNPFALLVEIALFATRMAGPLLSRVIPRLTSFSPRLANLLEKTPKNLFKLAPKGQAGNAGSRETMKQAFRKLADHPAFKQCVRDGKPK